MNQGQEQFYSFIMKYVKDGKQDEAKALLSESFAKQADGTFDKAYLKSLEKKVLTLLKPEAITEVLGVMKNFAAQFNK